MSILKYFMMGMIILILFDMIRVIRGKYAADRLVGVNSVTTKVCVIILTFALIHDNYMYLDIALVFVLCSFIGNVSILRLLLPNNQKELLTDIAEIPEHLQRAKTEELRKGA